MRVLVTDKSQKPVPFFLVNTKRNEEPNCEKKMSGFKLNVEKNITVFCSVLEIVLIVGFFYHDTLKTKFCPTFQDTHSIALKTYTVKTDKISYNQYDIIDITNGT